MNNTYKEFLDDEAGEYKFAKRILESGSPREIVKVYKTIEEEYEETTAEFYTLYLIDHKQYHILKSFVTLTDEILWISLVMSVNSIVYERKDFKVFEELVNHGICDPDILSESVYPDLVTLDIRFIKLFHEHDALYDDKEFLLAKAINDAHFETAKFLIEYTEMYGLLIKEFDKTSVEFKLLIMNYLNRVKPEDLEISIQEMQNKKDFAGEYEEHMADISAIAAILHSNMSEDDIFEPMLIPEIMQYAFYAATPGLMRPKKMS